jgi:hypothetical protein
LLRFGATGIGAIAAFADILHNSAPGAETGGDRAEILRKIIDELA